MKIARIIIMIVSPPTFLMVDFSTVLFLDKLPPMSFPLDSYIIREHSNFTNQLLNINCTVTSTKRALQLIDTAPVQRARNLNIGPNGNRLHVQARSLHVHT